MLPEPSARTIQKSEALTERKETIELVLEVQRGDFKKNTYLPLGNYHQQEADPAEDRIFGTFVDGTLAAVAQVSGCTPTGTKSTAFLPWKNSAGVVLPGSSCRHEIDACGHEELYMHSTLQLISFYKTFGFVPIPEGGRWVIMTRNGESVINALYISHRLPKNLRVPFQDLP